MQSPARRTLLSIRAGTELPSGFSRTRSFQSSSASRFSDNPSVIADPLCSRRCCLAACDSLCASFTSVPKVAEITVYSFQFPICHYQTADLWNHMDCHIGRLCVSVLSFFLPWTCFSHHLFVGSNTILVVVSDPIAVSLMEGRFTLSIANPSI